MCVNQINTNFMNANQQEQKELKNIKKFEENYYKSFDTVL